MRHLRLVRFELEKKSIRIVEGEQMKPDGSNNSLFSPPATPGTNQPPSPAPVVTDSSRDLRRRFDFPFLFERIRTGYTHCQYSIE